MGKNEDAKEAIADFLEAEETGKKTINYRLRDWGFHGNAIGGRRYRLFIAMPVGLFLSPNQICRSFFRRI